MLLLADLGVLWACPRRGVAVQAKGLGGVVSPGVINGGVHCIARLCIISRHVLVLAIIVIVTFVECIDVIRYLSVDGILGGS